MGAPKLSIGGRIRGAWDALRGREPDDSKTRRKLFGRMQSALAPYRLQLPVMSRMRDPFGNHVWVYACAIAIATAASQAPFRVYLETEREMARRRERVKRAGISDWSPGKGAARVAVSRYLSQSEEKRVAGFRNALEHVPEHPIQRLLLRPNPYLAGDQLDFVIDLWLILRGGVFLLFTNEEGELVGFDEEPAQVWPVGPDCFQPVHELAGRGNLLRYDFRPTAFLPTPLQTLRWVDPDDVVHVKRPDFRNLLHSVSPLESAAESVYTDASIARQMRRQVDRGFQPSGFVTHEDPDIDEEEERAFLSRFKQQLEGSENAGGVGTLTGGWKYEPLAMSPKDMETLAYRKMSREEVFAAMGPVPPSILGLTETTNYATAQAQKAQFWRQVVLPLLRLKETTFDATLFREQRDNIVGMYDLSQVDALRAGQDAKINNLVRLTAEGAHMPPRQASEVVQLELPEYEGDDVNIAYMLAGSMSPMGGGGENPPPPASDDAPPSEPSDEEKASKPQFIVRDGRRPATTKDKTERQLEFLEFQAPIEKRYRRLYRNWVDEQRDATLRRLDEVISRRGLTGDELQAILPDLRESTSSLRTRFRPEFRDTLERTFEFTQSELGVPIFDLDDRVIGDFFNQREHLFTQGRGTKLIRDLTDAVQASNAAGETIQALRVRVDEVFGLMDGSARSLTIARTESAGFVNGARNRMFRLQEFGQKEWSSSADEHVRDDHVAFDRAGPQAHDFDYLTIAVSNGGGGRLLHPHDLQGPAGQVINCRCVEVPA